MKTENIIHLALGVGLLGFAAYAINKMNKQDKQIAALKEDADKNKLLSDTVKNVKSVVDDVINRTKKI